MYRGTITGASPIISVFGYRNLSGRNGLISLSRHWTLIKPKSQNPSLIGILYGVILTFSTSIILDVHYKVIENPVHQKTWDYI